MLRQYRFQDFIQKYAVVFQTKSKAARKIIFQIIQIAAVKKVKDIKVSVHFAKIWKIKLIFSSSNIPCRILDIRVFRFSKLIE